MPYNIPMAALQELAHELDADERTLRRAAADGALRCRRPGPRRLVFDAGERDYLREHWELLARLRAALRTQPQVRLAVLYGSFARGDEDSGSDLDLAVLMRDRSFTARERLRERLEVAVGRDVDLADLEHAESDPLFLHQIIEQGRVIVDRDDTWSELLARKRVIREQARRAYQQQIKAAGEALEELTS